MEARDRLYQAVRAFFVSDGYTEVHTPIRVATPAMELHINAFASGGAWLRTSPELHMKRLMAAGMESIFQLGACFREGERGGRHHPEYTMLEWYDTRLSPREMINQVAELLREGTQAVSGSLRVDHQGRLIDLAAPVEVVTVQEAFLEQAGWDPVEAFEADRFDEDLVECVEPWLAERPGMVALVDFPAPLAALARIDAADPKVAERWELYLGGVELCNAYGELTDAAEQRRRFEAWGAARQASGRAVYPLDEPFLTALDAGFPVCSGAALGMDRWLMLALGVDDFDAVLPFREG